MFKLNFASTLTLTFFDKRTAMSTSCKALSSALSRATRHLPRSQVQLRMRLHPQQSRTLISRTTPRFAQAATTPSYTATKPAPSPAAANSTSTNPKPTQTGSPAEPETALPELQESDAAHIDWSRSFHGLSVEPFAKDAADVLLAPLNATDIEIKPDGIIYLPEIKYRRILNKAFGPGGWGLAPRGEAIVTDKAVTREYALLAHGRLVSIARGEQDYFNKDNIPTASEGCKSNAMMRCCKDLGVASELWDPRFIRKFKAEHTREVFVEHQVSKKKTKIWLRKGDPVVYPYKETRAQS